MSTSPFPRGFAYRLVNVGSKTSLHGANPKTSPGNVVHRTPAAWDSQRWVFSRVSADDDVYVISNLDSGQVLHGDNLRSGAARIPSSVDARCCCRRTPPHGRAERPSRLEGAPGGRTTSYVIGA